MNKVGYKRVLDTGVGNIGYTLIRLAPIMAAVPAMLSLLRAADYSLYAWFLVGGVELTGYALGELTVRALQKDVITWRQAIWPLGIYGLVIEGMLLGYDVVPAWANWYEDKVELAEAIRSSVSVLLPFFTLTGAGMLAIHDYLEEITADEEYEKQISRVRDDVAWQDDRDFKRAEREIKLAQKAVKSGVKSSVKSDIEFYTHTSGEGVKFYSDSGENFTPTKADKRRDTLHSILRGMDGLSTDELNKSEIARQLEITRPTLNSDLSALVSAGRLELNGHVKVK